MTTIKFEGHYLHPLGTVSTYFFDFWSHNQILMCSYGYDKLIKLNFKILLTSSCSDISIYRCMCGVTLNNASDYRTNRLYRTPNPNPLVC